MSTHRNFIPTAVILIGIAAASSAAEELYVSKVFVPAGKFTTSVEGPACNADGNLYAVSYLRKSAIGKVTPAGEHSLFVELPAGSTGNGIRFDSRGRMLIADYTGHNILAVDMTTREVTVFGHESSMSQPNDLAIAANDIVYASDPDWGKSTGRVWRIGTDGRVTLIASGLGTTNGIEVAPGDRTLYVSESSQNNILAFDLSPAGEISNKRVIINLPANSLDGMRCDMAGNLYITRMGTGTIAVLSPGGALLREVKLIGKSPSNIAFGGPDGRTCYVTMANDGSIETFRTEYPGREWQLMRDRTTLASGRAATPRSFTLLGAYPNPFNAATTIEYSLETDMAVRLSLYNLIGQRVALLREGRESVGRHAVVWNAGGISSGTYLVRMDAGGKAAMVKVMVVK